MVWTVFGVFSILLNMVSVPSILFLEKGNSLYFTLTQKNGRVKFFFAKLILILAIDFSWIIVFTGIYGIWFLDSNFFILWLPRLLLIFLLMTLTISLLSLTYTYRAWISWILLLLIVFGGILNKTALFPTTINKFYVVLSMILPPILEIIYSTVTLELTLWRMIFLIIAILQIGFYLFLNYKFMMRKDFI